MQILQKNNVVTGGLLSRKRSSGDFTHAGPMIKGKVPHAKSQGVSRKPSRSKLDIAHHPTQGNQPRRKPSQGDNIIVGPNGQQYLPFYYKANAGFPHESLQSDEIEVSIEAINAVASTQMKNNLKNGGHKKKNKSRSNSRKGQQVTVGNNV